MDKACKGALIILTIAIASIMAVCALFKPPSNESGPIATNTTCIQCTICIPYHNITAFELKSMLDQGANFTIVDVRMPEEYKSGHIPGAINIPMYELPTRLSELQGKKILVYCKSGTRSQISARILAINGIQNVWVLTGGLDAWIAAGYPIEYS